VWHLFFCTQFFRFLPALFTFLPVADRNPQAVIVLLDPVLLFLPSAFSVCRVGKMLADVLFSAFQVLKKAKKSPLRALPRSEL